MAADLLDGRGMERRPPQVHSLRRHGDRGRAGAETFSTQLSIPIPIPVSSGGRCPAFVQVVAPGSFVSDGGVVYAFSDIPFVFIGAQVPTARVNTECCLLAPTSSVRRMRGSRSSSPTLPGLPASFTPNLTPVYELTDTISSTRKATRIRSRSRGSTSSRCRQSSASKFCPAAINIPLLPVEARDQSQIEIFGPRVGSTIQAHEICDEFVMGPAIAQTILQRAALCPNQVHLQAVLGILPARSHGHRHDHGREPGAVELSGSDRRDRGGRQGPAVIHLRGVGDGRLEPGLQSERICGGFQPNWGVPAVPVNPPLIYEPPPPGTGGVAQIWVGASGINGGGGSQWGGANVYISVDNVTYSQIAVITAPMRQGFLTASLPAAAGWDAVDTLAVDLAERLRAATAR